MKRILFVLAFATMSLALFSQMLSPEQQSKYHMISADEIKNLDVKSKAFVETAPPTGGVRNIAEFERNQGVIVSFPGAFGIPNTLIAELAEDVTVYIVCESSNQTSVYNDLSNDGVNMANVEFVDAPLDSHWARDYSPWFIEYGDNNELGIVNFPYNRPRPNDDNLPIVLGTYFDMEVFGMNLESTGGNYMTDGMGTSASCDLVYEENPGLSSSDVSNLAADYLGADEYLLVADPLDDYIEHIDCWGKFLDVDKMLVASVPASDYRYADFEAMADYWANQTTPYGNNYQVYRTAWMVDGNAYTNSLIMNDKVLVPFNPGTAGDYNAAAAEVYEEAMPGYEIIGIVNYSNFYEWQSTDALHCRTHEVPDEEMLRIVHYPKYGSVEYQDSYEFTADVYVFNNAASISAVELFYSVDGGVYQSTSMLLTSGNTYSVNIDSFNQDETISYYIKAVDSNTKTETHPFIGEPDPHVFTIESSTQSVINHEKSYIKAFPNPAKDELYFIANDLPEDNYSCSIFDQQGKLVMDIAKDNYSTEWDLRRIDISNLPSGLYFVKATSEKNIFTTKFVKL